MTDSKTIQTIKREIKNNPEIFIQIYELLYKQGGWSQVIEAFFLAAVNIFVLWIILNSINIADVANTTGSLLAFISTNSFGLALVAGFLIFILVFLGKLYAKEVTFYYPSEKEAYAVSGVFFLYKLYFNLLATVFLIFIVVDGGLSFVNHTTFDLMMLFDYLIFVFIGLHFTKIQNELNRLLSRMDSYKEHIEYAKKITFSLSNIYLVTIISTLIFQIWVHNRLDSYSIWGFLVILLNILTFILATIFSTMVAGASTAKPAAIIQFKTGEVKKGILIRWERGCLRFAPEDGASLLVPKDQIKEIFYPYQKKDRLEKTKTRKKMEKLTKS